MPAQLTIRRAISIQMYLDYVVYILAVLLCLGFAFEFSKQELPVLPLLVLSNLDVWVLMLIGVWALWRIVTWSRVRVPPRLALPVIVWFAALLDSLIATPAHRVEALIYVSHLLRGVLVGLIIYDLTRQTNRFRLMACAVAVCGLLVGVFGLAEALNIQPLVQWLWQFKAIQSKVGGTVRISSVLEYTTIAAMILELTSPLLLAAALTTRRRWLKVVLWLGLVNCLIMLLLTSARGGILALAFALIAIIFLGFRRHQTVARGAAVALAVLVGAGVLWLIVVPTARLRLVSENISPWYQATYEAPVEVSARPGDKITVSVHLTNTGIRTWEIGGEHPFSLGYRLYKGSKPFYEEATARLPADVAPKQSVEVQAVVSVPPQAGDYTIEWDMYQLTTIWFSELTDTHVYTRLLASGVPVAADLPPLGSPITNQRFPPIGRLTLWKAALAMFSAHPLFGVGPDNFHFEYGSYLNLTSWDTGLHSNNLYLEWLSDTGILGLLAYLWVSWALLRGGWPTLSRIDDLSPWRLALFASLLTWYVHGFVDEFTGFNPTWIGFCIVAGLFLSSAELGSEDRIMP